MSTILIFPRQQSAASINQILEVDRKREIGFELFRIANVTGSEIELQRTTLIDELVALGDKGDFHNA